MISCAGAGNVEQLALGRVDLLKVCIVAYGLDITCVEPDAEMATVLAQRFAGDELVDIVVGTFETWTLPPTGVDLIYCAQAWHWVDPQVRFTLAHDALAPGGVLALEIGAGQAPATAELLRAAGFTDVQTRRDLGGIERVVSGVKA